MTPATIISAARMDGVILAVTDAGTIRATGDGPAVKKWMGAIREHKAAIISALKVVAGDTPTSAHDWLLHDADQEPQVLLRTAPATHAETLERHPSAVAAEQFDHEAFEERAAICEYDGGLSRDEAEAIAWLEDDRRRCMHCLNLQPNGVCKVASPTGLVVANRGYRPVDLLKRCEGYRPCPDDPDRRMGLERWPGLKVMDVPVRWSES